MLLVNLLMIAIVMVGIFLLAFGIMDDKEVQVFFGALITLTPLFWLTFEFSLLPIVPVFASSIMYIVRGRKQKQVENNS